MKNVIKLCLCGSALLIPSWAADVISPQDAAVLRAQKVKRILKIAANRAASRKTVARAADADDSSQLVIFRTPAEFTIAPKDCSAAKSVLTGKGTTRLALNVDKNADGTFDIDFLQESSGTVTDEQGAKYIYIYANSGRVLGTSGFNEESPDPPFTVYGPDTFRLVPVGAGTGYEIVQYFNLKVGADGTVTDMGTLANMPPGCDPI